MKKKIITIILIILSTSLLSQIHEYRFIKKITKKNININNYLENKNFLEVNNYDQNKTDLLTKPNNAALFNMKSEFKVYLNNENELLYIINIDCSSKENWNDYNWLGYRVYDDLRSHMNWNDRTIRRNYRNYIITTENGIRCAYLIIPYGTKYYGEKSI